MSLKTTNLQTKTKNINKETINIQKEFGDVIGWLPKYEPVENVEIKNDYNELKEHMQNIHSSKKTKQKCIRYWQRSLLSFVNLLGNVVTNFSTRNGEINKSKMNTKLIDALTRAKNMVTEISIKELNKSKNSKIKVEMEKILRIKDYMTFKECPKALSSNINIFNVYMYSI